jgi:uncharacterized membrane protein
MTDVSYNCFGSEPSWSLQIGNSRAVFKDEAGDHSYSVIARNFAANRGDALSIVLSQNDDSLLNTLITNREWCTDGMSDHEYAFEIFLSRGPGTDITQGCCHIKREP